MPLNEKAAVAIGAIIAGMVIGGGVIVGYLVDWLTGSGWGGLGAGVAVAAAIYAKIRS